ncbi:unnamed protein product [Sphenostylis stenocarpa]|uniref:Uncharacterized protein n=1 Tax=Sphenostylis stenocarpa TaxID=92480 RepID=A0AA86W1W7_9FABA|nr:unnamed protein product [Sphenostylis stenocarpa]
MATGITLLEKTNSIILLLGMLHAVGNLENKSQLTKKDLEEGPQLAVHEYMVAATNIKGVSFSWLGV